MQLDEPGLFVFASTTDAVREIEPIDAESQIRAAFDESGIPYRVHWLRSNQHRTAMFGLLKSIRPGEYELVPAGPSEPAALRALLEEHPDDPHPPTAKADLEALLDTLRAV